MTPNHIIKSVMQGARAQSPLDGYGWGLARAAVPTSEGQYSGPLRQGRST